MCLCYRFFFYSVRCLHERPNHIFKINLQKFDLVESNNLNDIMNMPPVALSYMEKSCTDLYYPKPLLQLWKNCTEAISPESSECEDSGGFNVLPGMSHQKIKIAIL